MLTGSIAHVENLGAEVYAQVDLTDQDVRVTFRASPAERRLLSLGALVELSFNPTDTMIFDAHGKRQRDLEFSKSKPLEIA